MIPKSLDISALRDGYRRGIFTPEEVVRDVLARVAAYPDPAVWISRPSDDAIVARARSLQLGEAAIDALPLDGIPCAVKDNLDVAGMETTAGCPAYARIAERTAFVVARLLDAGAILIGKTNLDQFASGLVGTRSPYGAPRCVFDERYISGGSSSGSAVAVAADLCSFSLGTDTAGSGRVPAAFNDIVGYKPTKGRLSTTGVLAACRTLDCVAILAKTVRETATVEAVATAFDGADPYARVAQNAPLRHEHFSFGVLAAADREFCGDGESAALYEAAIARLASCGGQAVEIDFAPFRETAAMLYGGPWVAERIAAIAPFFSEHEAAMDPIVAAIIGGGKGYDARDAFEAFYALRALERRAARAWGEIDVMLLPTTPTIFTVDEIEADPIGRNISLGTYTNFVNLLDYSAIAVPAGFRSTGLPFGITLVAPTHADRDLLALAERFEDESDDRIELAVAGAHLRGLPLNHQLRDLGATFVRACRTAGSYRLYALPGTTPPKPGLVRDPEFVGTGIEVEIWSLRPAAFGRFVDAVPAPMSIGTVTLDDGSTVTGFSCEPFALSGALEITSFGGWRAYVSQR